MSRKNNKKKVVSYALASALVLSNFGFSVSAADYTKKDFDYKLKQIQDYKQKELKKLDKKDRDKADFKATDKVRVIVEVEGQTPVEYATKQGKLYKELSEDTKLSITNKLEKQQKNVKDKLKSKGVNMNYKHTFSTAFNGFSGEVQFSDISKIEAVAGVKNVYLANEYNRPETPDMTTSHSFIQSAQTWADAKLKGEGMVVSVIDSGVDPSHKDFVVTDKSKAELDSAEVSELAEEFSLKGKFYTDKVPYGYNYYDQNETILDIGPDASMHGMHVAGTVAANGDETNGGIKGVAPEAQVLGMKVFSNDPNYPSTWSDIYLAAIDDSIKLGADVLNMSLGSTASFYDEESAEDLAITRAVENGIVASVSAGNSGHISRGLKNPYAKNPDIGLVGAPGLNADTIQVAASGNVAYLYEHNITVEGVEGFSGVGYGVDDWTTLEQPIELVSLGGKLGKPEDYAGVDVSGKVVVMPRGELTFVDKTKNAAAAGAAGIIVYNSTLTSFYKDQGGWQIPFMKITRADGLALEEAIAEGHTTLNFSQANKAESPEMGKMTEFTSWGTTPSLDLKPEITAPGGKIVSTLNDDQYGEMSGTSMAAPHVAGGSALVQQYLQEDDRFAELTAGERTRLAKALLMNTAEIIEDQYGQPFSPRRQGAGMMQTFSAVDTPVYMVDSQSGEAKVELKDFTSKSFEMKLTANNISDEDVTYKVDADVLTDMVAQVQNSADLNTLIAGDMEGAVVEAPETITVPAGESKDFTVKVDLTNAKIPGFDKDGNAVTHDLKQDIFVEGFVTLTDEENLEATLSVPYVGFYGEWDRPDIVDGFTELGEDRFYKLGTGWNEMLYGEGEFVAPVPEKGFYPVSPNGDGWNDDIYPLPSFLRNADEAQFNILDKDGKFLRRVLLEHDVRKNYFNAGNGNGTYSFNPARAWDGKVKSQPVPDGLYQYEIKTVVDYEGAEWQSKKIPVYVDNTAPEVKAVFHKETSTVTWETVENGTGVDDFYVFVNGELAQVAEADVTSVQLSDLPEKALVEVAAVDYASNVGFDEAALGDTENPLIYLDLSGPEPFGVYNSFTVPVTGYVTDDLSLNKLTVNGEEVPFTLNAENGRYYFTAETEFTKDGYYDVIVTAEDHSGKEFSISRKVFIDTTGPVVDVTAPKFVDNAVEEVKVTLNLKDNFNYLSLYVGDNHEFEQPFTSPVEIMKPADKTVELTLPVELGQNNYQFKLVDLGGNETIHNYTVYRNEDESRVNRVSGANRYVTAAEISKKGWESAETVVLARGDDYADALAGVPLAKKHNAPLLLTATGSLPAETVAELERLGTKNVVILGGEKAISAAVVEALTEKGYSVERLSGKNRYATAAAVASAVAPGTVNEVVVANGANFPDALSVASYAAAKGMPILLTGADELNEDTKKAIRNLGVKKTIVVGGKAVVSDSVAITLPNPYRVSGKNRYETAVAAAEHFAPGSDHYYVATGTNYADALAGAALAAQEGTGILLVGETLGTSVETYIKDQQVEKVTILGGKASVNEAVEKAVKKLFE
ncbi:cell wall-binding repeat-containing protein [Bacillus sp. ISL-55]|uniref:cell wall-binding repeat-containing protein n=1 Tax=Bacillus sp. ISL-55 TaxID=2819134 RepID=UPI001BEB2EAA|nr:S8 family serine peptidase [Bacillus sp. ISL-55]